jgi:hypothetical protein
MQHMLWAAWPCFAALCRPEGQAMLSCARRPAPPAVRTPPPSLWRQCGMPAWLRDKLLCKLLGTMLQASTLQQNGRHAYLEAPRSAAGGMLTHRGLRRLHGAPRPPPQPHP